MEGFCITEREARVYDQLLKFKYGGIAEEWELAFDCTGVLGNECLNITLDQRLDYVEQMICEYLDKHPTESE